jgi:hypothetical protein
MRAGEIDVANLSLAGRINSRNEDAVNVYHEIQRSVNAGAVYVAAAAMNATSRQITFAETNKRFAQVNEETVSSQQSSCST